MVTRTSPTRPRPHNHIARRFRFQTEASMSGLGSGGWRSRSRWRMTLEDLPSLDVLHWLRGCVLVPGMLFEQALRGQNSCGSVGVAILSCDLARLLYRTGAVNLIQIDVGLHWTDCRFGGRRPWFACPCCGRQSGRLYLLNHWRCRDCCALPYRSQTLTPADRLLHRAAKLRQYQRGSALGEAVYFLRWHAHTRRNRVWVVHYPPRWPRRNTGCPRRHK